MAVLRSVPRRLAGKPWSLLVAIILFSILAGFVTLRSFLSLPQHLAISQQCRMSYMLPAYIDHTAHLEPFSPSGLWRKYRLYHYRERTVDPVDVASGSPVVFVPGNAGSYGQIRSVASSAARQYYIPGMSGLRQQEWQSIKRQSAHTDWWTVDFNEDFSAFSGSTLIQQATFLNEVISYLRHVYPSLASKEAAMGERNLSIPFLAHSMGGIAARLMTRLDNHPLDSVDTIVTLSTPHAYPPAPFDRSMENVYQSINAPYPDARLAPLLVSIAGGLLDTQLPSDPSSLSLARIHQNDPFKCISTFTSSFPSLWSSVDHLAVMWCDQLREKIARGFLLDSITFGTIFSERNADRGHAIDSLAMKRRELWRRVLGISTYQDGGNGATGPVELLSSGDQTTIQQVKLDDQESPTLSWETSGASSVLQTNSSNSVYHVPAHQDGQPPYSFEMVTNLCIGVNPWAGFGSPIAQPVQLTVLLCRRSPDLQQPVSASKAICQPVEPWQWQMIPPSPLPNQTDINPSFPDANQFYHTPGVSYQRLRIDSQVLRQNNIDWIRIERHDEVVRSTGLPSFLRSQWVHEESGKVEREKGIMQLKTINATKPNGLLDSVQSLVSEWTIPSYGSSLLAYDVELVPTACILARLGEYSATLAASRTLGVSDSSSPGFSPLLLVSHPATGDSRWFPNVIPGSLLGTTDKPAVIRLSFSLHGASPFVPPPLKSLDALHVQLWSDPALLASNGKDGGACLATFEKISIRPNWRASLGLILLRYRLFVAAWPLAILVCVLAVMWHSWTGADGGQVAVRFPFLIDWLTSTLVLKRLLPAVFGSLTVFDLFSRMWYRRFDGPSTLYSLVIGMPEPMGLAFVIIAVLLAVSFSVLLFIVWILHHGFGLTAAVVSKMGLERQTGWHTPPSSGPPKFKPRSWAGITLMLGLVMLFVPHQFVFLCIVLLHGLNVVRARVDFAVTIRTISTQTRTGYKDENGYSIPDAPLLLEASRERYHQFFVLFVMLFLLLPQKVTFLLVWVRDLLSIGIQSPKTLATWNDHNVLDIIPMVLLVWICAGGRIIQLGKSKIERKIILIGWIGIGFYSLIGGLRYTFQIYDLVNGFISVLVFCHWRERKYGSSSSSSYQLVQTTTTMDEYEMTDPIQSVSSQSIQYLNIPSMVTGLSSDIVSNIDGNVTPSNDDNDNDSITRTNDDKDGTKPKMKTDSSQDLDSLISEYLVTLDHYQSLRTSTSTHFAAGFLKLSRARIEFGNRIGRNSYDERLLPELTATVVTLSLPFSSSSSSVQVEKVQPDYSFLYRDQDSDLDTKSIDDPSQQTVTIFNQGLRQHRPQSSFQKVEKKTEKENPTRKSPAHPDSLLQFVGLPSSSLRTAQSEFRCAVYMSLGIATGQDGLVQTVLKLSYLEAEMERLKMIHTVD